MKKIIFAAAAALSLMAGAAQAQTSFGLEAGLNLTSLGGKVVSESTNSGIMAGARVGGVADIMLTDAIYFRPGIQFSLMGGKNGDFHDLSFNINYLQIPLNVLYKLGEEGSNRFYFGLTPYVGVALGGKVKSGSSSEDLKIGDKEGEDDIKRLDFGLGAKVGYEFSMGFGVDASFNQGLSNVFTTSGFDLKNRNISIGLNYFFGRD